MFGKKGLRILTIIITMCIANVFLCGCSQEEMYITTEEALWRNDYAVNELIHEIEFALNMDYIETENMAGFSYNNSNNEFSSTFFELFVLKMSELSGKTLLPQEYDTFIECIKNEKIDVYSLNIDELYLLSELLKRLNYTEYFTEIEQAVELFWDGNMRLYDVSNNHDSNVLIMFATTWYAINTLDNVSASCLHLREIKDSFDDNLAICLKKSDDSYLGYVIRLANRVGINTCYKDELYQWIKTMVEGWTLIDNSLNELETLDDLIECAMIYGLDISRLVEPLKNIKPNKFISPRYDEYEMYSMLEYFELCEKTGIRTCFPINLDEYICTALKTEFAIRGNTDISPVYTYYGLILADFVDYPINYDKIKNTIVDELSNNIGVIQQTVSDEYVMNTLFTLMCAKKTGIEIKRENKSAIINNLTKRLRKIDYTNIETSNGNLYIIQFCCESFRLLEAKCGLKNKIARYLDCVVNSEMCVNTIYISDLKLIYDIIGEKPSDKLLEQIDTTCANLFLEGGYCYNLELREEGFNDIVSTAKMWRILGEEQKTFNSAMLEKYIKDNKAFDEYGNLADLRCLYYLKVYLNKKIGES